MAALPASAAPALKGDIAKGFPTMGSFEPAQNVNPHYYRLVLKEDSWVSFEALPIDKPYQLVLNWKLVDNDGVDTWCSALMYWQDLSGKWSYGSTQAAGVDVKSTYKGVVALGKGEYFLKVNGTGLFNYMFMTDFDRLFTGTDAEPNDKRTEANTYQPTGMAYGRLLGSNGIEYKKPGATADYVDYYVVEVDQPGTFELALLSDGFFVGDLTILDSKGGRVAAVTSEGLAHKTMKKNEDFAPELTKDPSNKATLTVNLKAAGTYYLEVKMSWPGTYGVSFMNEAQKAQAEAAAKGMADKTVAMSDIGKLVVESGNLKLYYAGDRVTITGLDPDTTYMITLMPTDLYAMMTSGTISASIGGDDDWEPNNSLEEANKDAMPVPLGKENVKASFSGKLAGSFDEDFFMFTVKELGSIKLTLSASGLDPEIELLDDNGSSIIKVTKRAGRDSVSLSYELEPGTYYIAVRLTKDSSAKDYSVEVLWEK